MSENCTSKVKKSEVLCFLFEKSAERWDFEFSATDVCLEFHLRIIFPVFSTLIQLG